jgi:hypothetical protein
MDQGVIAYRKHYQDDLLRTFADEDNITALWEKIMLDAVYSISPAWSSVNPATLV